MPGISTPGNLVMPDEPRNHNEPPPTTNLTLQEQKPWPDQAHLDHLDLDLAHGHHAYLPESNATGVRISGERRPAVSQPSTALDSWPPSLDITARDVAAGAPPLPHKVAGARKTPPSPRRQDLEWRQSRRRRLGGTGRGPPKASRRRLPDAARTPLRGSQGLG
jgi:hypothetical protein